MNAIRIYVSEEEFKFFCEKFNGDFEKGIVRLKSEPLDEISGEKPQIIEYILDKTLKRGQVYSPDGEICYVRFLDKQDKLPLIFSTPLKV